MALTAVDLSQASRRVTVPTLAHELILGAPTASVGSRAGVATLQVIKDLIGGTTGLNQSAVDARVKAGVRDWAEIANFDNIPSSKLSGAVLTSVLESLSGAARLDGRKVRDLIPALNAESGVIAVARLGTGVASSSVYLRGDGAWAAPSAAGLDTSGVDARIATWARVASPSGSASIARGGTGSGNASGARSNLGLGSAAQAFTGTAFGYVALLGIGGRFTADRLGSGVASSSVFLRGDGAWVTPPAPSTSGLTTTQVDARIVTWARASSPTGMVPLSRGGTSATSAVAARSSLGLGTAATHTVGTGSGHLAALGSNGRFALARLGSGSPASDRFLRGDGAWQVVPFNASGVDTRIALWARTSSPSGQVPIARGGTAGATVMAARNNLGIGTAASLVAGNNQGEVPVLGVGGVFAVARGAVPRGGTDHQNLTWENGSYNWRSPITLDTLRRVTKIPAAFNETLLYLTHDEIDNTTSADNADLVPGVNDRAHGEFFGWTRGHNGIPATGTLTPNSIPVETIGTSEGTFTGTGADRVVTGWAVEFIGSRNQDFAEQWPIIVIGGTYYNLGGRVWSNSYGLWLFAVTNGPTGLVGTKTINFLSASSNGLYLLSNGTAITRKAGLWVWNGSAYYLLAEPDFEEQLRALSGQASGEGWGFTRDLFRHKSWWLGSDRTRRLLGMTISPEDAGKTWAVTRADGAIRLRSSQSEYEDLTGAEFDPDGVALAAATAPISMFDASVVEGWTDPNVMATPGLWAAHKRTSADASSGSVTFVEGDKTNAFTLGYRHVQRLPPDIISGGADGYLSLLNLSTANGIYIYLALTSSDGGSAAGPNFTEAARRSLGIAVRAANGQTGKWRISDLGNDSFPEPYRWTGASIPTALVNALKAANAQVVLVDTSNANVNWDNLTFGGVSSETQGVGINNAIILQNGRLRVWRGADEVDVLVGTTLGANYRLPVLPDSNRWIGPDADTDTLYALRVGDELHLARLPYSSIVQPAHSGTSQQLRAVITAGPATGKLWDSDMTGAGSVAAGSDLELTQGLTIGSLDIAPEVRGTNEVARMAITSGDNQELNLATNKGSFAGDNQLIAGLSVGAVQVNSFGTIGGGSHYVQLGLNRASGETVSFGGWRTTSGQGLGKAWYVVNPDGTYLEFTNADSYSSGSSWLNIQSGVQNVVSTYAPGGKFTLICADAGGLTPHAAITLKRNAASITAVTAWLTHESTHSFYFVSPTGTITEMLLSTDTPTAEHLYWLVANGPLRPAVGEVFKILIATKGGITAAEGPASIAAPSIIQYTLLPVPKGSGATAQPGGVPVAMSVRNNRLSILYSGGGVARFNVGATTVARVASEDIDLGQYTDPATPSTLIMSDYSLLHQASDFIRKWTLVLGGSVSEGAAGGVSGGVGGAGGDGGGTTTQDGRVRQIFFARASMKPDAPHYTYIGGDAPYSPPVTSGSVWQGSDPDTSSTLPLWMATAESVERATGGWQTNTWTVIELTTFTVEYSNFFTSNQVSNWHPGPLQYTDNWMRLRGSNGQWGAPLRLSRTIEPNPWTPLLYSTYIAGASLDSVHQIWGNKNFYGRSELMFRVKMFDEFVPGTTTDEPLNELGIGRAVWSKMSTSQPWPFAPSGNTDPSNNPPAKDQYAFRLQASIRDGLSLSLGSDAAPEGDVWKEQLTFWIRFVKDSGNETAGNHDAIDQIQIFGFGTRYNRGNLDISMR